MRGRWPGETRTVGGEEKKRVCVRKTAMDWKFEAMAETRSQGAHRRLNGQCQPLSLGRVVVADVAILRDLALEGTSLW